MNYLLLPLFFLLLSGYAVRAQDTLTIQRDTLPDNSNLSRIQLQALPDGIRDKLAGADYNSWQLQAAYKERGDDNGARPAMKDEDYVIVLKKGDETIRVRFDNAGNRKEADTD